MGYDSDTLLLLVDLPNTEVLLSADTHECLRVRQVSDDFDSLSMDGKSTVELLQLPHMQQADRAFAHAEGQEFLEASITPYVANRRQVKSLV